MARELQSTRATGARGRRVLCGFALLCGLLGAAAPAADGPTEHEVKAAYIYYFAKFIDWPPTSFRNDHDPFVIGLVGEDPFGEVLERVMSDKQAHGRDLVVKRLQAGESPASCHILYVSPSAHRSAADIIAATAGAPVLTVSAISGFTQSGGVINFFLRENRVKFEVNMDAGVRAGLSFRAQLLKVAALVSSGEER